MTINKYLLCTLFPPQNDWRVFECNTWHLEPTVRLISWAGGELEPYGVDYILQRLGFAHARTTIPKWLQRGCMDPLDKVLSFIVLKAVQLVQEEKKQQQQTTLEAAAVPAAAAATTSTDATAVEDKEKRTGGVGGGASNSSGGGKQLTSRSK